MRNVTRAASTDTFPSFSHDGAWIYFSSDRSGVPFIWKIPVAGGTAIQVSHTPGLMALESRDGAYLYYVESPTVQESGPLWQVPLKGGAPISWSMVCGRGPSTSPTAVSTIWNGLPRE